MPNIVQCHILPADSSRLRDPAAISNPEVAPFLVRDSSGRVFRVNVDQPDASTCVGIEVRRIADGSFLPLSGAGAELIQKAGACRLPMQRIRTSHEFPPIPDRSCDWSAVDGDNYEGGDPIGWGPTEEAAVADLLDRVTS